MSFLLALGLAVTLTPVARRVGSAAGLVDRPVARGLKIHTEPVPLSGGIAVVISAAAAVAVLGPRPQWGLPAAALVALGAGLLDDARPLPPWGRVVLIAAAGVLLAAGTAFSDAAAASWLGLVLLVLACANAVNIVDGQDGLAGGLAAISALGLAALAALDGDEVGTGLGLALGGALIGFLLWNRPPARVFLGNSGAYAVGTLLAFLAARVIALEGWRGVLSAGACLGPIAFELVFTVIRRTTSKDRLSAGDRLHSYDLLSQSLGRVRSTLAFWLLGAAAGGFALLVAIMPLEAAVPAAGAACAGAALWGWRLWARRQVAT